METEHEEQQQEEKIELPPTAYRSARRGAVSAEPFDPTDAAPSETVRQFSCETHNILTLVLLNLLGCNSKR